MTMTTQISAQTFQKGDTIYYRLRPGRPFVVAAVLRGGDLMLKLYSTFLRVKPCDVTLATPAPSYREQLQARACELRRRSQVIAGRARPSHTHRYTGLFVCGDCGKTMTTCIAHNRAYGLRCCQAYRKSRGELLCVSYKATRYEYINAWMDERLRERLDGTHGILHPVDVVDTVPDFTADIERLETQIRRLIYEQSLQVDDAQPFYRDNIARLSGDLKRLQSRQLERDIHRAAAESERRESARAAEDVRALTIERFWQLSEREINQLLHRLVGQRRFVIKDQKIIGYQRLSGV